MTEPSPGAARRPSRWRAAVSECIGLGLITLATAEMFSHFLGTQDRGPIVMLAVGYVSHPAQQLLVMRRSASDRTRRLSGKGLLAMLPVLILWILQQRYAALGNWDAVVPPPAHFRELGVVLSLLVAIAYPVLKPSAAADDSHPGVPAITLPSLLLVLSLLLASFSIGAAFLTVYWFAAIAMERGVRTACCRQPVVLGSDPLRSPAAARPAESGALYDPIVVRAQA